MKTTTLRAHTKTNSNINKITAFRRMNGERITVADIVDEMYLAYVRLTVQETGKLPAGLVKLSEDNREQVSD